MHKAKFWGSGLSLGQAIELPLLKIAAALMKTRLQRIEETIASALTLSHLDVADESAGTMCRPGPKVTSKSPRSVRRLQVNRGSIATVASMHCCKLSLRRACMLARYTYTVMRSGSNATA